MSDSCQKLQTTFTDILKDLMSMSADVIKKSNIHLSDVESLDVISVDTVTENIRNLLNRVNTNLSAFVGTFDTAVNDYKLTLEKEETKTTVVSPKHKVNLSLNKNGDTQETDIDLTNSDEDLPSQEQGNLPISSPSKQDVEENGKSDGGSSSDTDSEKSGSYFDVPVTNGLIQGLSEAEATCDELVDKVNQKDAGTSQNLIKNTTEPSSFDFDEVDYDEMNAEMDKIEQVDENKTSNDGDGKIGEEEVRSLQEQMKTRTQTMSFDFDDDDVSSTIKNLNISADNMEQNRKDNDELLDLLNKAIGNSPVTVDRVDQALEILDVEFSLSSETESIKSSSSSEDNGSDDDRVPSKPTWKENEIESDGNLSDVESLSEEQEPEYQLKSFEIKLPERVDQMTDAQIAKLCSDANINKRKCDKTLQKFRKRKRKRKRISVITDSSSSSSFEISSDGSTTPDLVIDAHDTQEPAQSAFPGVAALADELADQLDKSDDDDDVSSTLSSESETTEPKEKKQKTVTSDSKKEDEDVQEITSDEEIEINRKSKKTGSWRNEIMVWSSDDDDELISAANDILKEKNNDEEDTKEKLKLKLLSDETMVISTDSADSNSDSDDVTFIDEVPKDDSPGKGRKNIRAILSDDELNELTQQAKSEEDKRILRLTERSKTLGTIQSQHDDFVLDFDVKTGTPLITVHYKLANMLKPHQKDGVKFMWEACYESAETLKDDPGTGCILAHCMGLGKTLQVITLIHTLFTHEITRTKYVLVICPLSTVINWRNEFRKTFELFEEQTHIRRYFIVKGDVNEKIRNLKCWRETGGVLVMGYESFQILTNEKLTGRVTAKEKQSAYEALINPGPDLIVCDEGHQLKNDKTLRTKALMKVKTKRRIVLTGTPLQNNLNEYYYMVQFVKPHLLGTHTEYKNRFATPIQNGQYHDSKIEDIKLMKKRTHVLTKLLKKTIHREEATVLSRYLPEITDFTIFIKLTELQMKLYTKYIDMVTSQLRDLSKGFFTDVMLLNFNNLHPYTIQLYYNKLKPKKRKRRRVDDPNVPNDDEQETPDDVNSVSQDWFKSLIPEDISKNINYSMKLKIILEIIDECEQTGDKILVFARYLVELDLLENFLKDRNWRRNYHYYRMDGETLVENRDELCKNFNTNETAKVFLLTHKVGGLGLNLTGANRVIMIGSNHNPTLDTQSMYRVYRFGQTKKCYIYRLLSLATMEEKIYHRCVVKLHLSGTVVDKLHFDRRYRSSDLQEMYKIDFSEYSKERPIPTVPNDLLLALLLQNTVDIYRYHPHNSLLENRPEEELTDEDKKLAWDEFNNMEEAARANATNLVPNPLNNNTRGFIPRGFLNGIQLIVLPTINRHLLNKARTPLSNPNTPQSSTSNRPVGEDANQQDVLDLTKPDESLPVSKTFQNLREDIVKIIQESSKPDEPSSVGEFNYILNKFV